MMHATTWTLPNCKRVKVWIQIGIDLPKSIVKIDGYKCIVIAMYYTSKVCGGRIFKRKKLGKAVAKFLLQIAVLIWIMCHSYYRPRHREMMKSTSPIISPSSQEHVALYNIIVTTHKVMDWLQASGIEQWKT